MRKILTLIPLYLSCTTLHCQEDSTTIYSRFSKDKNLQSNLVFSLKNIDHCFTNKNRIYFGNAILKGEAKYVTKTNIFLKNYFSYGVNWKNYYQNLDDEFFIGEAGSNNISTIPNNYSLIYNLGFGLGYVLNMEGKSNFLFDFSIETGEFLHQSATKKEYQTYTQGWFFIPIDYWGTDSTKIEYNISSIKYTKLNIGIEYLYRITERFSFGIGMDILFKMPKHYRLKEYNVRNGVSIEKDDFFGDLFGSNNKSSRTHMSFGINLNYNIPLKLKDKTQLSF